MLIIDQSHEILAMHISPELIELCGRTCYKSEPKGDPEGFVSMLMGRHHDSVLEHSLLTVRFITNRGVTHEIVRHRLASFCLSGDTVLPAFRDTKRRPSKKWTLKQLYDWQTDPKRKGRLKLIRIRSVDGERRIVPGVIKHITSSGVQEVFTVKCRSGRTIKATMKHRFLTPDGYRPLAELAVGSRIMANGLPALENRDWLYDTYIEKNNTLTETAKLAGCCVTLVTRALRRHGINKPLSMRKNRHPGYGQKGMFTETQRLEIAERMSGAGNPRWKGGDITDQAGHLRAIKMYKPDKCWGCGNTTNLERHHCDKNPKNNDESNILFLCASCHKGFHFGSNVLTVFSDEIIAIESAGYEDTYDLEMEGDPHNFVANGLVVHNSQESTRYVNYEKKGVVFIRPEWGSHLLLNDWNGWAPGQVIPNMNIQSYVWLSSMHDCGRNYLRLLELGLRPEQARGVLPNDLKTEIVVSANAREWRHIFKLRTAKAAHPDMQALMIPLLRELRSGEAAVLFNNIEVKD